MNTLTMAWLRHPSHRACDEARAAFAERWPDGTAPLSEVLLALADHPKGLWWWNWLVPWRRPDLKPIISQYLAAHKPIKERYAAARKPIEDQLWAARKPIEERCAAARKPIEGQLWAARKPIEDQRLAALNSLDEQYAAAFEPIEEQYDADCRDILRRLAHQLEEEAAHEHEGHASARHT